MNAKVDEIKYVDFESFISDIQPNGKYNLSDYIFRGESSSNYKLIPSALRKENSDRLITDGLSSYRTNIEYEYLQFEAEYMLLKEFYSLSNKTGLRIPKIQVFDDKYMDKEYLDIINSYVKYKWISEEFEELAALAQHYGVITRLLDWTYDRYTALYFANIGAMRSIGKKKNMDDDYMVLWALSPYVLDSYKSPLKFIVPSYYNNPNLKAQRGVLTYWQIETQPHYVEHMKALGCLDSIDRGMFPDIDFSAPAQNVNRTPLDQLICSIRSTMSLAALYKFMIPVTECLKMYDYLDALGYNTIKHFPNYSGIATQLKDQQLVIEVSGIMDVSKKNI